MGAYVYTEPGAKGYNGGIVFSTMKTYACTPQEAEERGYHRLTL